MPHFNFKIGDFVRSTFRGRWIGVVLDRRSRKDSNPIYTVRIVLQTNHHPMGKSVRSRPQNLDEGWLIPYSPLNSEEAELLRFWSDPTTNWSGLKVFNKLHTFP